MPAYASLSNASSASLQDAFAKLEASASGRLGVYAINTANNMRIDYRAEERFPFCSTFKTIVAAAILNKSMTHASLLQKRIHYSEVDVVKSGYAPITEKYVENGMTVIELCAATLQYSDNAAANFLMQELGGPQAITAYARSLGDDAFQLSRWEPELNAAIPGDPRDTSTPSAMTLSLKKLILGDALALAQREQLIAWLKGNTTGGKRMLAAVPAGWIVGDKTGTGSYGTTNDAGALWPPSGKPIIATFFFTQHDKTAAPRDDVIAAATRIVIGAFS